jgi:DNA invertase Pin-like site-specific DNA recombinase
MMLQVMAAFSQFERALISERTVDGLKAAKARGSVLGRVSPTMIPAEQRSSVVKEWKDGGRVGGVRGLGRLLGGCSSATAARLAKESEI